MTSIARRMLDTIEKNAEARSTSTRRPLRIPTPHADNEASSDDNRADLKERKSQDIPSSISEYSSRSQIARAYGVGEMPFAHRQLFLAIKRELNGEQEGEIILQNALETSGIPRRSALNILKHMANFGVLVSEARYRRTWVKISPEWISYD